MSELKEQVERRRDKERGACLKDVMGYPKKVLMLRATIGEPSIGQMDYVYVSLNPLKAGAAERAIESIEEGIDLIDSGDKLLRKTIEHACTTSLYHGEICNLVVSAVDNSDIYEATNTGEYFYDGESPKVGVVIAATDENGLIMQKTNHSNELKF